MVPEFGQYNNVGVHNFFFLKIHDTPQNSGRHKKIRTKGRQILGASLKKITVPVWPPEFFTPLY